MTHITKTLEQFDKELRCSKCNKYKSIDEFYPNKTRGTRYQRFCKLCDLSRTKSLNRREYFRKYYQNNKEKFLARQMVRGALKSGILKKLPCSICKNKSSEAHHEDYTKPLDVIFFCRKHHMREKTHKHSKSNWFHGKVLKLSLLQEKVETAQLLKAL
jgi:hypothetical protein